MPDPEGNWPLVYRGPPLDWRTTYENRPPPSTRWHRCLVVRCLHSGLSSCARERLKNTHWLRTTNFVWADIHRRSPKILRKVNLDAELKYFADGALAMPALVAGELDVTATTLNAGFFNTVSKGAPFKLMLDRGSEKPGTDR